MSSTQPGNEQVLGKIVNTDLNSSDISNALESKLGNLKVIKTTLDISALTVASDGVAVAGTLGAGETVLVKDLSGHPISLNVGESVISFTATATTAAGASTQGFGLVGADTTASPPVPDGAISVFLIPNTTAFTGGESEGNASVPIFPVVPSADPYIGVTSVGAVTSGVFEITIIVA